MVMEEMAVANLASSITQLHAALNSTVGAFRTVTKSMGAADGGGSLAAVTAERDDLLNKYKAAMAKIAELEFELFEKDTELEEALAGAGSAKPAPLLAADASVLRLELKDDYVPSGASKQTMESRSKVAELIPMFPDAMPHMKSVTTVDKSDARANVDAEYGNAASMIQAQYRGNHARRQVEAQIASELTELEKELQQEDSTPASTDSNASTLAQESAPPPTPKSYAEGSSTPGSKKKKSKKVYYVAGGERTGPVAVDTFVELIQAGSVQGDTHVWTKGMGEWAALEECTQYLPQQVFDTVADFEKPASLEELLQTQKELEEFLENDPANEQFQMLLDEVRKEIADKQ